MSQHYQRNVTGIMKFCPTCNKMTMHKVSNKRLGTCMETHVAGQSDKQKKQAEKTHEEPSLF